MAKKKTLTYSSALEELQGIMDRVENNEVDIDDLSDLVKRANELTKFCEERLKKVEGELDKSMKAEG